MYVISTTVGTESASKYLQQLCKHFAHKAPATFDAQRGEVAFPFGNCTMEADDKALSIRCEAPEEEQILRCRFVIDDHLTRFAWREKLSIDWKNEQKPA
ncbi:MAG: DUF2218 domain-containing protein [Flavobacteriaceae bacterium]